MLRDDSNAPDMRVNESKLFAFFGYIKLLYQVAIQKLVKCSGLTEKIVSAILTNIFSNLIFIPLFSIALFVIYMAHYHFFSYDFFIEGIFGMKLFVLTAIVFLFAIASALFSSFLMLYANKQKQDTFPKVQVYLTGIINLLLIFSLVYFLCMTKNNDLRIFVIVIAAVSLYLAVHLSLLIFSKNKKIKPLVFMLMPYVLAVFLVIVAPGHAIKLLEIVLRGFGVGNLAVEIHNQNNTQTVQLVLLSPKTVYYIENYCPNNTKYNVVSQPLEGLRVKRKFEHEWACGKERKAKL